MKTRPGLRRGGFLCVGRVILMGCDSPGVAAAKTYWLRSQSSACCFAASSESRIA
jgi:hypothetical protein